MTTIAEEKILFLETDRAHSYAIADPLVQFKAPLISTLNENHNKSVFSGSLTVITGSEANAISMVGLATAIKNKHLKNKYFNIYNIYKACSSGLLL